MRPNFTLLHSLFETRWDVYGNLQQGLQQLVPLRQVDGMGATAGERQSASSLTSGIGVGDVFRCRPALKRGCAVAVDSIRDGGGGDTSRRHCIESNLVWTVLHGQG